MHTGEFLITNGKFIKKGDVIVKKILSGLLVVIMTICMFSTVAFAQEADEPSKIGQIPTVVGIVKEGVAIAGYIENGDAKAPVQQDRLKLLGIDYANMKYVDDKEVADDIKAAYNLLMADGFKPESLFADLDKYAIETYDYHAGAEAFVAKEMFYVGMPDDSSAELLNADNTVFKMDMLTSYSSDSDVLVALMKINGVWTPIDIECTDNQTTTVALPQEGVVVILRADKLAKGATAKEKNEADITGTALLAVAAVCIITFICTLVFKKKTPVEAKESAPKKEDKKVEPEEPKKKLSSDGYYDDDDEDDDD